MARNIAAELDAARKEVAQLEELLDLRARAAALAEQIEALPKLPAMPQIVPMPYPVPVYPQPQPYIMPVQPYRIVPYTTPLWGGPVTVTCQTNSTKPFDGIYTISASGNASSVLRS